MNAPSNDVLVERYFRADALRRAMYAEGVPASIVQRVIAEVWKQGDTAVCADCGHPEIEHDMRAGCLRGWLGDVAIQNHCWCANTFRTE